MRMPIFLRKENIHFDQTWWDADAVVKMRGTDTKNILTNSKMDNEVWEISSPQALSRGCPPFLAWDRIMPQVWVYLQ